MKVAIVGTHAASHGYTPWGDPSWSVWTCSEANLDAPRFDEHHEVHSFDFLISLDPKRFNAYVERLSRTDKVWIAHPDSRVPKASIFPYNSIVKELGPFGTTFLSSSPALMMAKAIYIDGAKKIGLYGIDMSEPTEYDYQRPGIHFFVWLALQKGIDVIAPPVSDILQPMAAYGFREFNPFFRKQRSTLSRIDNEILKLSNEIAERTSGLAQLQGARDIVEYDVKNWSGLK